MTREEFCGYYFIEIDKDNLETLGRALSYWNLNGEDMERCVRRTEKYHRADLAPIRKILGVYILEWMLPFSSRWTRRIYYNVPGTITWMYWIRQLSGTGTYVGSPDFISMAVLYGLFGIDERIETGSCRHCAVNLMRSAIVTDPDYPDPDIQISFGFTCDEAPKQDSLISESVTGQRFRRFTIANPLRGADNAEDIQVSLEFALRGIKQAFHITDDPDGEQSAYSKLKSARFRVAARIHSLIDMVRKRGKFCLTNNDIVFLESLLITSYACGMDHIEVLLKELHEEAANVKGEPVRAALCIYYTPICNPDYGYIMEKNGLALLDHTSFGNNAIYTGIKDPCEDAAVEGTHMLIAGNAENEGKRISELIKRKGLDGFVSGMFAFDRWMGMQQHQLKTFIEDTAGASVFMFDTDFWNQEAFSCEKLNTAAETLICMLEAREK